MEGRETPMTLLEDSYLAELRAVRAERARDQQELAELRAVRDQLLRALAHAVERERLTMLAAIG